MLIQTPSGGWIPSVSSHQTVSIVNGCSSRREMGRLCVVAQAVIPAFRKGMQEGQEFHQLCIGGASLGCMVQSQRTELPVWWTTHL